MHFNDYRCSCIIYCTLFAAIGRYTDKSVIRNSRHYNLNFSYRVSITEKHQEVPFS